MTKGPSGDAARTLFRIPPTTHLPTISPTHPTATLRKLPPRTGVRPGIPLAQGSFLMLAHLLVALLQTPAQARPAQVAAPADTSATAESATAGTREHAKKPIKRIPLTPELLASAFKDPEARSILLLARDARMHQDSALQGYDATTYQRISAGFGFSKIGRERLAFRSETATHVRWRRGVGAYVDVTGARAVVPIAG